MSRAGWGRGGWLCALSSLWLGATFARHRRFQRLLADPESAQRAVLDRILARARDSAYGRHYRLDRVRTSEEFIRAVPAASYEDLVPWIERVERGEQRVLSDEPVLMMETTSGSAAAAKYIPYTAGLRDEFDRALGPWLFDVYSCRPHLLATAAYWSISPAARRRTETIGGVPVGFESDAQYLSGLERFILGQLAPAPPMLAEISDMDANRYATLLFLLAEPRLGLLSVWNPSYLGLLLDFLDRHAAALVADLAAGTFNPPADVSLQTRRRVEQRLGRDFRRARDLERILERHGNLPPTVTWPRLSFLSCWAAAAAARFLPPLRSRLPGVEIQPKGLLATEGVVTIPITGLPAPVLALDSHFFEFRPLDHPGETRLAHELETGRRYSVILSTAGGLYRYELRDEVRVVGHHRRTPMLEFLGREAGVSDLCGEKLADSFVNELLDRVLAIEGLEAAFVMLAPRMDSPPRYVLYFEPATIVDDARIAGLVRRVDEALAENPHYAYCRSLGQLGPLEVFWVTSGGQAAYLQSAVLRGQKPGSIKAASLRSETDWSEVFTGRRI